MRRGGTPSDASASEKAYQDAYRDAWQEAYGDAYEMLMDDMYSDYADMGAEEAVLADLGLTLSISWKPACIFRLWAWFSLLF